MIIYFYIYLVEVMSVLIQEIFLNMIEILRESTISELCASLLILTLFIIVIKKKILPFIHRHFSEQTLETALLFFFGIMGMTASIIFFLAVLQYSFSL